MSARNFPPPFAAPALALPPRRHQVVIAGAGVAGIAVAKGLLKRDSALDIAIVDPSEMYHHRSDWTRVGAGMIESARISCKLASLLPARVKWFNTKVGAFEPEASQVVLQDGQRIVYEQLVICTGLKQDWAAIPGLRETLGRNGVTSNYLSHLAPYTWDLVRNWKGGRALFTQPAMSVGCGAAPQTALYLSCDAWRRARTLRHTQAHLLGEGAALFDLACQVPALMAYIKAYGIELNLEHKLIAIDGPNRRARIARQRPDGRRETIQMAFDMIHVVPPQIAPDCVRRSALVDAQGRVDVDPLTLMHRRYRDIFALGDVSNSPNIKGAGAIERQAPVVVQNLLVNLQRSNGFAHYDGYGVCTLAVERGKAVLAECLYGGKAVARFPSWLVNGARPSRMAWFLKEGVLPRRYWGRC